MKAANRIRAYLAARKASSPTPHIFVVTAEDGSRAVLTIKDLEKILASRDDFRDRYHNARGAASSSEHMLVDNIRIYAEALQLSNPKNATAADVLTEIKHLMSVRDVLAGKLRPYTGDIPADVRTLAGHATDVGNQRDALRKRIQEITDRFLPAWSRHTPEGQLAGITNSLQLTPSARAEKMRERVAGLLVLPADATYEQCTDRLRLRLFREQRVFGGLLAVAKLLGFGEPEQEPNFDPETLVQQIAERLRRREQSGTGPGVWKISEARAYQIAHHHKDTPGSESNLQELTAAALALLLDNAAAYPFGFSSFKGIKRYGGRTAQLAHAGACIAALIDLQP